MRCNNCGFENAPDTHHCVKCNMLLDVAETKRAGSERPSPPLHQDPSAGRKETFFAGTIPDSPHPATAATIPDRQDESPSAPLINCPHPDCGYPYSSELKACPRCKRPATAAPNPTADKNFTAKPGAEANFTAKPATVPNSTAPNSAPPNSSAKPNSTVKPNPIKGTIDPYRIKAAPEPPPPSCWLLPITKAGEKPAEAPQTVALVYDAQPIDLNRDTLEPNNTSITGKVQAQMTFKDGAWQLKDQSDLQTTFLQVSTETTLKDGDIILFGDRKFIFSLSNPQEE